MTTPATPKPRKPYVRPTKYPAQLSTMLRQDQRDAIDTLIANRGESLGEVTRGLLDDGLALSEAYFADDELRADVERLAREGNVEVHEALETLLRFAVTESARRVERNARVAIGVAKTFAEIGVEVDAVSVGSITISHD